MTPAPETRAVHARERATVAAVRLVSGTAFALGLLGVLNTGVDDLGADSAQNLFVWTVHPITALVWLALGLVGIAMSVDAGRARSYAVGAGGLLVAWAVLALALGDDVSQALTRDAAVVALHLAGGALLLASALAPYPQALTRLLTPEAEAPAQDPPKAAP